ncbi:hypothetical protein K469DRAFT_738813 [Zopfia rhizophila CBS 207.26]|uniref:Phytanoyl-CoA dioxygenase family protein n=1 Tax=Zopfia rhizophila CBS 207.26 TaxID=1314779 RepID=A0A6A6E7L6_9PEZI|nr:hypothetical protein K469DRAFT_738813 [Zopfia rhizophila CBS 207.26]
MSASNTPLTFQNLVIVLLSDEERVSQRITSENVGIAVSALHRDGIVALENAVDLDHIDRLNSIMSSESDIMASLPTTHRNHIGNDDDCGNISQSPPLDPEFIYGDIWANPAAAAVLNCLLGPNPCVTYVNGNTALGGYQGTRQRVHADVTFNHGLFPFAIVVNYYLVDASPANGSTEIWLGSHRDTTFADQRSCGLDVPTAADLDMGIREDLLEARRAIAPPIQPTIKRGSVILRDLRLWHAGVGNPSPQPRVMLAFVHMPWWYRCPAKVKLPEKARELVERWARQDHPVQYQAEFLPGTLDHKLLDFTADFSSSNKGYRSMLPDLPEGFVFRQGKQEEG